MKQKKCIVLYLCLFLVYFSLPAQAIDWSNVESKTITLFYPGQSSWEWILTQSDHSGAKNFRKGKSCRECHEGEEQEMGNIIVVGGDLEPTPIAGMRGSIDITVKTANDASRLYILLAWQEANQVMIKKMGDDQVRVTVLLDDGHVSDATRAGCWSVCHDDTTGMPSALAGKTTNLYLAQSRTKITRSGGGENYKSADEIDQLLKDGIFLEYWQAILNQDKDAIAIDGYVLDKRYKNKSARVSTQANYKEGIWTVELSRELITNDTHYKDIVPGKNYMMSIALHDAYSKGRRHYVSFPRGLALDKGVADHIAVKQ